MKALIERLRTMRTEIPGKFGRGSRFRQRGWIVIFLSAAIVGAFLRLYLIRDQILLDDEWHGLMYALIHPLFHPWSYSNAAATCPPLNAYFRILLDWAGWSEGWLRLPSLLAGILALVIFPLIVKKAHGAVVAAIFAVLLAFSPFLTFYSRVCRPYSMLVFLLFVAVYTAGFWLLSGKRKYWWLYLLSSALATCFHSVAAVTLLVPLLVGAVSVLFKNRLAAPFTVPAVRPSLKHILLTGGLVAAVIALTVQPAVISGSQVPTRAMPSLETWKQFVLLLFGTASFPLALTLLLGGVIGSVALLRHHLFWGSVFVLLLVLHVLLVVLGHFESIDAALVLARYVIILFPVSFVCVALGLDACCSSLTTTISKFSSQTVGRMVAGAIPWLLLILLVLTSPLWNTYAAPENFTNHSAFQESYESSGWEIPRRSAASPKWSATRPPDLPAFYQQLPAETRGLIEYPMMIGDHFNLYYYYQHFHKKRIIAGYSVQGFGLPKIRDFLYGNQFIDQVLSQVADKTRLRFSNMVDILDVEAVRNTRAEYLILHRNLLAEFFPERFNAERTQVPGIDVCTAHLRIYFGSPVYADRLIIVFDVSSAKARSVK